MPKHYLTAADRLDPAKDLVKNQAEKEEYIEWLATPAHLREIKSQKKMAEHLGVSDQTLRNWKRDPRVTSRVKGRIQSVLSIEILPDIVETLKEQALDASNTRSVQAARTLIEMMEKGENAVDSVPLADMTIEQLRDLAASLHDEFDDRKPASA